MTEKEYMGFTKLDWQMLIQFALLVAVVMLAYNVGQYDSLQYQAMCNKQQVYNTTDSFNISDINLNKNVNIETSNDRQDEAFS